MKIEDVKHLYWRLGFGASLSDTKIAAGMSRKAVVDSAFAKAEKLHLLTTDLSIYRPLKQKDAKKNLAPAEYRRLNKKSREDTRALAYQWIEQMSLVKGSLRDKMTLFWTNVFVCQDNAVWNAVSYHNMLRENALGNLGGFLKTMAREPAMLRYLNNNKNVKKSPNENFAREVLELFTLGIGNYTEQDIKEAARAFTGWTSNRKGEFTIIEKKHDHSEKTFLGKTGNWNGDDIIDIILEQKQCAQFICSKIYAYFINPKIDASRLEEITAVFYKDYNIAALMRYIFRSDWFYELKNQGAKIKSPIELLVGIKKTTPVTFKKQKQILYVQKMMGQFLFFPPNVAGWKGDRNWIDANTLLFRMSLPSALLNKTEIQFQEKAEFEDSFDAYYKAKEKRKAFIKTDVDWATFENNFKNTSLEELQTILIATAMDKDTAAFLKKQPETSLKDRCIQLMSLPEYQMC